MAHNKPQPEFFIDKSAKTKPFGERERKRGLSLRLVTKRGGENWVPKTKGFVRGKNWAPNR
jgi:hypothetical protein